MDDVLVDLANRTELAALAIKSERAAYDAHPSANGSCRVQVANARFRALWIALRWADEVMAASAGKDEAFRRLLRGRIALNLGTAERHPDEAVRREAKARADAYAMALADFETTRR